MRTKPEISTRSHHWLSWMLSFLFIASGVLGYRYSAYAQIPEDPSGMRAAAEQLIAQADSERAGGRAGTAIQHYEAARDAYLSIADAFPEWSNKEVQSRLFYCRQAISSMEQDLDAVDDDELGSILDMIERSENKGSERAASSPQAETDDENEVQIIQPVQVREKELIVEDAAQSVPQTERQAEILTLGESGNKRFRKDATAKVSAEEVRKLQQQLADIRRQNDQLNKEKERLAAQSEELKSLQEGKVKAEDEQKAMRKEIRDLQDKLKSGDRTGSKELEQARREIGEKERLLKEAQTRETQLKKELQQARISGSADDWDAPVPMSGSVTSGDVSAASGHGPSSLDGNVKQLEDEKRQAMKTISDLQARIKDLERSESRGTTDAGAGKRAELEAENRKITVELNRTRDQLNELQRQWASRKEEQRVLSEEMENADTRWSQDNLKLKQELNRERSLSMELQETVTALRDSLDKSEQNRLELLKRQQEHLPVIESAKSEYEAQNAELKAKLNQSMQDAAVQKRRMLEYEQNSSRLSAENRTVTEKLNALQEDYLKLANSTALTASENVKSKSDLERLKGEMNILRKEAQEKESYAEQLETAGKQMESLQADLGAGEKEQIRLKQELKNALSDVAALKQVKANLELTQLEKVEWNQNREQLQARLDDALAEKMDVDVALAKVTSEKNNTEKLMEKMRSEHDELLRKNEELQKTLSAGSGEKSREFDSLTEKVYQLQQQVDQKEKKIQELAHLEKDVTFLRSELDAVNLKSRDAVKNTQLDLITQKKKAEMLSEQLQEIRTQLADKEAQEEQFHTTIQQLENEKTEMGRRLDSEGKKQHEELLAIKKESALEKEQAAKLQDEIRRLQSQVKEATDVKLAFEKKLIESEKEKDDLEREINESDEAWRVKLAAAMKESQTIAIQNKEGEKTAQQERASAEVAKRRVDELNAQLSEKDKLIVEISRTKSELETKIAQAVDAATEFTNKTESELSRIQKQNAELRAKVQEMDKLGSEIQNKDRTIKQYEAELKAANDQLTRLNETKKQWNASNAEVQNQLKTIQDKVTVLTGQLSDAQQDNSTLKKQLEASQNDVLLLRADQKQSGERDIELSNLKQEVVRLRKSDDESRTALAQARDTERLLNETRQQLSNVQKSNELNVKLVDRMKKDLEIAQSVGAQLSEISKERDQLVAQASDWRTKYEKLSTTQADREKDDQERNAEALSQTRHISELNVMLNEKQQAIAELTKQLEKTTGKLKIIEDSVNEGSARSKEVSEQNVNLQKQVEKLTADEAASGKRASDAETRFKELEIQVSELSRQKSALDKQQAELMREKEHIGTELETWKSKAETLRDIQRDMKNLQGELAQKTIEQNKTAGKLSELEKSLQVQQKAALKDADDRRSMQERLAGQIEEMEKIRAERDSLSARVQALTKELTQATETLESLANY